MSRMENLPTELLLRVIHSVQCEPSLAALTLTNRQLHHLCNPILYEHNVLHNHSSVLSWAAQKGRLDTFQKALDAGAPLPKGESFPRLGITLRPQPRFQFGRIVMSALQDFQPHPISLAAENGHEDMVRFMIDRGVGPNITNAPGHTVLALAALHGHASLVEFLLNVGARQEIRSLIGQRPIWLAAFQGHTDVVNLLLSASTERKDEVRGHRPSKGRLMDERLFDSTRSPFAREEDSKLGPSKDQLMSHALFAAVEGAQIDVLRALFQHGVDVNVYDMDLHEYPLHIAASHGQSELVSLLLAYGADPNLTVEPRRSTTPLSAAVIAGHEHLIPILFPGTASLHRTRALAFAVTQRNRPLVKTLLDRGTPPQFEPGEIPTPLFVGTSYEDWVQPLLLAVQMKDYELVEMLLNSGADVNMQCTEIGVIGAKQYGKRYDRVLFWAVGDAHESIVKLLLGRGTDPEASDIMGCSPLAYAVRSGNETIVQILLDHGANPHRAVDYIGRKFVLLEQTKESIRVRLSEAEAKWK